MTEIAAFLKITFLALIVFYVCIQVALLISEVGSAEKAADTVPRAFRGEVSLAAHRKAIDFTAEVIQSDTLNALAGAAVALIFTLGGGLDLLWAFVSVLTGDRSVASQFLFVILITLILAVLDMPLDWWRNFRINERYGIERTNARVWMRRRIRATFFGWVADLPIVFAALLVLNLSSYFWWILCLAVSCLWFFWHEYLYPNWVVGFSKKAHPLQEGSLKRRLQLLLTEQGYADAAINTMVRPAALKHANALFARSTRQSRLVLFQHTLTKLTEEELLAVVTNAVAHVARWHRFARCILFFLLMFGFWWGFAWLSEKPYFYEALGIHPMMALENGAVIPGVLIGIVLTTFPVVLYPVVFLVHLFTRMLEYDADACVVHTVGAVPLIRAIVKLHTDYRNTLTPNRLYSLANHRRPHITQRILAAQAEARKLRHLAMKARQEKLADRQAFFNAILMRREENDAQSNPRLVQTARETIAEAANLKNRTIKL